MSAHRAALLRACCLLLLVAGSRQLSIKDFVVPKAVETGNAAELRCKYELASNETEQALFVKWWWTPDGLSSDFRTPIYQRIAGQPAEYVHITNSSNIEIKADDTIVLTNVTPVDSGTYECEVYNIDEQRRHEKLVVFQMGTGPLLNISEIMNSTVDGQSEHLVIIECHAEDVAPRPEITVSIDGKEINMTIVLEDDDDQNGLYTIYANTSLSAEVMDGSEVRCEIFFTDDHISHPPYVDMKTFVPAGYESQSTTGAPEDASEPDATPESLQNPSGGVQVHCSWCLLATAFAIFSHIHIML